MKSGWILKENACSCVHTCRINPSLIVSNNMLMMKSWQRCYFSQQFLHKKGICSSKFNFFDCINLSINSISHLDGFKEKKWKIKTEMLNKKLKKRMKQWRVLYFDNLSETSLTQYFQFLKVGSISWERFIFCRRITTLWQRLHQPNKNFTSIDLLIRMDIFQAVYKFY